MDILSYRSRKKRVIYEGLTMTKQLLKSFRESLLRLELASYKKPKYADDVIECMQFGICDSYSPQTTKEIPYYFHF